MSPFDGPSKARRAWRLMASIALVLAAVALLVSVLMWSRVERSRDEATTVICRINNEQNRALRALIVRGAKASRPFEELYREFGAPPYPQRLEDARTAARLLPRIDCRALRGE